MPLDNYGTTDQPARQSDGVNEDSKRSDQPNQKDLNWGLEIQERCLVLRMCTASQEQSRRHQKATCQDVRTDKVGGELESQISCRPKENKNNHQWRKPQPNSQNQQEQKRQSTEEAREPPTFCQVKSLVPLQDFAPKA